MQVADVSLSCQFVLQRSKLVFFCVGTLTDLFIKVEVRIMR